MSAINLKQLIHNVKEAYLQASNDADDITYGNIADKIANLNVGSSGLSFSQTVYERYGISREEYPYMCVRITSADRMYFQIGAELNESGTGFVNGSKYISSGVSGISQNDSLEKILGSIVRQTSLTATSSDLNFIIEGTTDADIYHADFPQPEGVTVGAWLNDIT